MVILKNYVFFVSIHFLLYSVDVLDKGCWVINIQFYVGCRVCKMVKSYLCVSVPILDDDCGAYAALFMMMVSLMISFFRTCLCVYVRLYFSIDVFHYVYNFCVYFICIVSPAPNAK